MVFFLPKQPVFFEYFKQLNGGIKEISVLFAEFTANFRDFDIYAEKSRKIEQAADVVMHEIVKQLNQTFITPFDREDIYLLAQRMDDIVDLIENAIHNIDIYQITEKSIYVDDFAHVILEDSHAMDQLIRECFTQQHYTQDTYALITRIHELENQGDDIFQKALRHLFSNEKDPILIIKWKDIFENMEHIVDKFEQVCDTFEGIMVKSG